MTELPTYILERSFDAPRELVWRTWTDPDLVHRWYGPGVETVIHRMDVAPGGLWLTEMKMGGGSGYQRVEYLEVEVPEKLVWLHSTADAEWNVAANPMMPDWPKTLLTTVTFAVNGPRTDLRLTWVPHEASDIEIACFAGAIEGLDRGWGSGMEKLAELLRELQG
ncbi:SRPBCC domain-containing protein [Nisaea acidiphila]|uniref:SRPBCC domain-containing protein n=1 Tax=Nisaea acidiphila TaxID=1862145 RepID=A0A9J7AYY1_9PROT|nr:SRPBCC domain-containing protein [Nisaea acidiphila]UUX51641.1 SRPBCC domain-containing protein [Nisaea acidiphila]